MWDCSFAKEHLFVWFYFQKTEAYTVSWITCYAAIFLSFLGSIQDLPFSLQCIFLCPYTNCWAKRLGYVLPHVLKWTLARCFVWQLVVRYTPPFQRFHGQCRGQTVTNTLTLLKPSLRESTTNILSLFMLSAKLNLKLLPTMTRVLLDTYFSLPLQGILGIMGRIYGERYRKKAILCTSPSSDSKLSGEHTNAGSVYHFAGSWS